MNKKIIKPAIVFLLLFVVTFAIYASTLNNFFLSDDFDALYTAKYYQNDIVDIFSTNNIGTRDGNSYRPLVSLTFLIGHSLWQLNPIGYHLISVLLYAATAFLVYLIAKKLWLGQKKELAASLAGLFFVILSNHTEVAVWTACYPDLLATFFYLLSFYIYLVFSRRSKAKFFIMSLLFFVLSLLAKEIAISLPFVLIVYEFLRVDKGGLVIRLRNLASRFGYILWYFVFLAMFFIVRFFTTGYLFGYYGSSSFTADKFKMFRMSVDSVLDMFLFGTTRASVSQFMFDYRWFFVIGIMALAVLIFVLLRKRWRAVLFIYAFFILTVGPTLSVNMSLFNDGGERYFYLPSVAWCIFLAVLTTSFWKKHWKYVSIAIIVLLLMYYSYFSWQKKENWNMASNITKSMITKVGSIVDTTKPDQALVFVGLPETYQGAQMMRNAINYALEFYYPEFRYEHYFLPIYVRLDRENWNKKLLDWQATEVGFYARAVNDKYIVDGFDTRGNEDFYYELRGYDYNILMSNSIWLEVLPEFYKENQDRNIHWLTFDNGHLQEIDL